MPFQIARTHVSRPDPVELEQLRTAFAAQHCVKLPGVIEPAMLAWIRDRIATAPFVERVQTDVSEPCRDTQLSSADVVSTILAFVNDSTVFRSIRDLTGCDPIGCYWGRVFRLEPGSGQQYTWHDDVDGNRMLAMSVNVGGEPYEGGALQIRDAASGRPLFELTNTTPGDAVLMRIGPDIEHRVMPVTGAYPRTALAGWFQRVPSALRLLKERASA